MIGTIASVIRGEGLASAGRRAGERIEEAFGAASQRVRWLVGRGREVPILNVSATPVVARLGGVPIQLLARLDAERALREVALLTPEAIAGDFDTRVRRAIEITRAHTIHIEGTHQLPVDSVLRLIGEGVRVILSIHDFTLDRRELLDAAAATIFPSHFLRAHYGGRGEVIEPGSPATRIDPPADRRAIAFAGSVKPHKGGELLPDIIRATSNAEWHVFGGGDEHLLRALRGIAHVHGYYRAGTLPRLLARHRVGLVVLPSIVPESFGLVLSEAWLAGAAVIAFDRGALAERIRREGGGWVGDVVELVKRWIEGARVEIPRNVPTPRDAAEQHVALYARAAL